MRQQSGELRHTKKEKPGLLRALPSVSLALNLSDTANLAGCFRSVYCKKLQFWAWIRSTPFEAGLLAPTRSLPSLNQKLIVRS
jgi:hypothetical protein